jgi:SAM-dependent methyltransferase
MSAGPGAASGIELEHLLRRTLPIYELPGQAYWRALELSSIIGLKDTVEFDRPILEIGCADGVFASEVFDQIDDGIDINERAVARARRNGAPYQRVHLMDARQMTFSPGSFGTVFANCVIEHIPDLPRVLASSHAILRDGGQFIATVPLSGMNDHLTFRSRRYCDLRRRQLTHLNLHDPSQWRALFRNAGFTGFELRPYLDGGQCQLWDRLDAPVCVGVSRRGTIGTALRLIARALPPGVREAIYRSLARRIARGDARRRHGSPCAAAIVATK